MFGWEYLGGYLRAGTVSVAPPPLPLADRYTGWV